MFLVSKDYLDIGDLWFWDFSPFHLLEDSRRQQRAQKFLSLQLLLSESIILSCILLA